MATLGQVAYEKWTEQFGGPRVRMPWDQLRPPVRAQWETVATAIIRAHGGGHVHPHFITHPLTVRPWCVCPCGECQGHAVGREGDDCMCEGCTCGEVTP